MFLKRNLFKITANALEKEIGGNASLKVPPSWNEAKQFRPICIVRKTTETFFGGLLSEVKLRPTGYSLNDIMIMDETDGVNSVSKQQTADGTFGTFTFTYTVDAKGKLQVFSGKVTTDYDSTLTIRVNGVKKEEIDIGQLKNMVQHRKLDTTSKLFKRAAEEDETLCLVEACYVPKENVTCTRNKQIDARTSLRLPVHGGEVKFGLSIDTVTLEEIEIPAGTVLAYVMREILVRSDGSFDIQMPGDEGGYEVIEAERPPSHGFPESTDQSLMYKFMDCFCPRCRHDVSSHNMTCEAVLSSNRPQEHEEYRPCLDVGASMGRPREIPFYEDISQYIGLVPALSGVSVYLVQIRARLQPILTSPNVAGMRTSLIQLLKLPDVLDSLNLIFQLTRDSISLEETMPKMTIQDFQEEIGIDDLNSVKPLLQIAGICLKDNQVTFPESDETTSLLCTSKLLEVLTFLNADQTRIFCDTSLTQDQKEWMISLVDRLLVRDGSFSLDDVTSRDLLSRHETRQQVETLGIQVDEEDDVFYLSFTDDKDGVFIITPVKRREFAIKMLMAMCAFWSSSQH